MRKYVALWKHSYYGGGVEEMEFYSDHRANSKANKADALMEIRKRKERGISNSAEIIETYLVR